MDYSEKGMEACIRDAISAYPGVKLRRNDGRVILRDVLEDTYLARLSYTASDGTEWYQILYFPMMKKIGYAALYGLAMGEAKRLVTTAEKGKKSVETHNEWGVVSP